MSDKLPHLIIFNPDQWRSDVLGHMGNPAAVTPNLDRIVATDAVSFRNAFCQNPVCTPSRCSFMSGWYPHVRGHRTMYHMLHPEHDEPNLLKTLKAHGYFVWWGGKNDLVPGQDGYAEYCDVKHYPSEADFRRWGLTPREGTHGGDLSWRGKKGGDNYFSFMKGKLDKGDEDIYCDPDWAQVLAAIDLIQSYDGDKPLCIFLPIQFPHPPYCAEEPFFSMIERDAIPERIPAPESGTGKPAILEAIRSGQGLEGWTEDRWRELRAVYYAMCTRVDAQYGRIVDALREAGMYDDSALFLFSDHGDFTGDYGLVEKSQNTFEDCLTRVPFIIKPPADWHVQPGVRDGLVELIDFAATVYDITGIDPGYDHFGHSLRPMLANTAVELRDAAFCEGGRRIGEVQAMERESNSAKQDASSPDLGLYYPRIRLQVTDDGPSYHGKAAMCRTREFKYVMRLYERDELYDLTTDPGETVNLVADSQYADVLEKLRNRLLQWYMETCDVVPRQADQRA